MAYNRFALTDRVIKAALKSGKGKTLADGHGLSLLINENGAAYWQHSSN